MIIVKLLTLLSFTIFAARTQFLYEDDTCIMKDGSQGVCTLITNCTQALIDLKSKKYPLNCSFKGTLPIVCCAKLTAASKPQRTCPPIREELIKVKKTGRKSWDKCIDWVEYAMPCTTGSSFLINAPLVRRDDCSHGGASLILGGGRTVAGRNEFPHMAHLGYDNPQTGPIVWSCGGTLISGRWVMTAAHCLYNRELNSNVKYVRLGNLDRGMTTNPDLEFTISRPIPHPDYNHPYNDIGLLQLNKEAKLSADVIPACLHTGNQINDERMLMTGWGDTTVSGKQTKILQKEILEKFNHSQCSIKYPTNRKLPRGIDNSTQICAGHHTLERNSCQEDSGGPLQIYNVDVFCMYVIVGITSTGKTCEVVGQPAIYTRVSAFVPWIEQHVWP